MKCDRCGIVLANTSFKIGDLTLCPICWLGKEGKESKYWETSKTTKPIGFKYSDDSHDYAKDKVIKIGSA